MAVKEKKRRHTTIVKRIFIWRNLRTYNFFMLLRSKALNGVLFTNITRSRAFNHDLTWWLVMIDRVYLLVKCLFTLALKSSLYCLGERLILKCTLFICINVFLLFSCNLHLLLQNEKSRGILMVIPSSWVPILARTSDFLRI